MNKGDIESIILTAAGAYVVVRICLAIFFAMAGGETVPAEINLNIEVGEITLRVVADEDKDV